MNNKELIYEANLSPDTDELSVLAVDLAVDIANITPTKEFLGKSVNEFDEIELPDGTRMNVVEVIGLAIKARLATAYLAGRADQIADSLLDNTPRTVRAKKLPGIIDAANALRPDDDRINKKETLEFFKDQRGVALEESVMLFTSTDHVASQVRDYIEAGDISFIAEDGEPYESIYLNRPQSDEGEHNG